MVLGFRVILGDPMICIMPLIVRLSIFTNMRLILPVTVNCPWCTNKTLLCRFIRMRPPLPAIDTAAALIDSVRFHYITLFVTNRLQAAKQTWAAPKQVLPMRF